MISKPNQFDNNYHLHHKEFIIIRVGVAGADLQTALSVIHSFIHSVTTPFPPLAGYNRLIPF